MALIEAEFETGRTFNDEMIVKDSLERTQKERV